ncbi:MAG TPA: CBS domain-containing protein [Myxococcota bacterium]
MYEFLSWRVRDVMTREVVTLAPEATIAEAEERFARHDYDALPVLAPDGSLLGIVSKLDVLRAYHFTPETLVPRYEEIRQRPVRTVMSTQPLTVAPDTPLSRVLETLVATHVKSVPVVQDGRLVGIVSRSDVVDALRRAGAGETPSS